MNDARTREEPALESAEDTPERAGGQGEPTGALHCDFCGRPVSRVRRVALDEGYDRLQTPHAVRYACAECSEAKERQRKSR